MAVINSKSQSGSANYVTAHPVSSDAAATAPDFTFDRIPTGSYTTNGTFALKNFAVSFQNNNTQEAAQTHLDTYALGATDTGFETTYENADTSRLGAAIPQSELLVFIRYANVGATENKIRVDVSLGYYTGATGTPTAPDTQTENGIAYEITGYATPVAITVPIAAFDATKITPPASDETIAIGEQGFTMYYDPA